LADPYKGAGLEARQPLQSTVYQATKVISEFRQGRFEQTIEGAMYFFPIPSKKNTVAASQAAAENNALAAAGAAYRTDTTTAGSANGGRDGNATAASTADRLPSPNISAGGTNTGGTLVNQLANGARTAAGLPAPNTISASAPPPPPALGFPIGPLPPALPPVSNGVIVGPAANDAVSQAVNNITSGFTGARTVSAPVAPGRVNQSYNLYSPQRGARDN
jgi:hypothetical protein